MAVSLSKSTYSVQNGTTGKRSKEYTTPRNAMRFGAKSLPSGEHSIVDTRDGEERVLVTFHKV